MMSACTRLPCVRFLPWRCLLSWVVFAVAVLPARVWAQAQTFDEWRRQDQAAFREYREETTRAYEEFLRQETAAYQAFVREAGALWGEDNVLAPRKKVWVQYTDDLEERSAVDFEQGTARVEILVAGTQAVAEADIDTALCDAVHRLAVSGTRDPIAFIRRRLFPSRDGKRLSALGCRTLDDIREFTSYRVRAGDSLWGLSRRFLIRRDALAKLNRLSPDAGLVAGRRLLVPYEPKQRVPPEHVSREPILGKQLRLKSGAEVTPANAAAFARETVAAARSRPVRSTRDGKTRTTCSLAFPLVPEHLKVRARRYAPLAREFARQYGLRPELVMAVMHTESAFNPRARSPVPAFGLMQLVPRSGGRDAYRLIHGKDGLVTDEALYRPRTNVQMGCAYLHIIGERYLKHITDADSRRYCTMAAYNTGAGNVARAFTGGTSVRAAAPAINAMSPPDVFAHLRARLPYKETRDYIQRVTDRMPLYAR